MKLKLLVENRNFRNLWIGQLVSSFGDRLTQMGILTFVLLAAHDNGSKVAFITFFSLLPFLVFGPLFGALADRCSRKNLMLFADVIRAGFVILIPIVWLNTHNSFLITTLVFILGTLGALFAPAKISMVGEITVKEDLLEANSLIITTGMVATLVGTLFAGLVLKFLDARASFYINSFTYLISAFFVLNIVYKTQRREVAGDAHMYTALFSDLKAGLGYIRRHRLIIRLIMLSCIFSVISSFAYILILNYGSLVLREGPFGIGVLLACAGFGMGVGSLIVIRRKDRIRYNRALYLSYLIVGSFCLAFVVRPNFYYATIILFCAGIGASILTIVMDSIMQRVIPDELKGKIFAARGVVANAVFLGSFLAVGLLIKFIPVIILFGLIGGIGLCTSLALFLADKRWGYQLLRLFLRFLMRVLFNFRVTGLENLPKNKRVILAGNHTSIIDGIALMCAYPGRIYFLVADIIFKRKFFGWCVQQLGYIPIKRGGFNKESIKNAIHILKSGYSIGVFPEGKITQDGRLSEGKEGVALIAKLTGVDIVPFAIEGAYEAWPVPRNYPRRFPIEVRFGSPVDITEYPTSETLTQEVMQEIAAVKLTLERDGYVRVDPNDIIRHIINIG